MILEFSSEAENDLEQIVGKLLKTISTRAVIRPRWSKGEDLTDTHLTLAGDQAGPSLRLCDLGMVFPKLGSVSITELTSVAGPFGLKIERDLHMRAKHRSFHGSMPSLRGRQLRMAPCPFAYVHSRYNSIDGACASIISDLVCHRQVGFMATIPAATRPGHQIIPDKPGAGSELATFDYPPRDPRFHRTAS